MFDVSLSLESTKPLQNHVNFVAAVNAFGGRASTLGPCDSVILRHRFMGLPVTMLPRINPNDDLLDHVRHYLKTQNLSHNLILFSPDAPCPKLAQLGAFPIMTPATVAELDLTTASSDRRQRMQRNQTLD